MEAHTYVQSDTNFDKWYKVVYYHNEDRTTCECPAFVFSGYRNYCKHIRRVKDDLVGEVEEELKVQEEALIDSQLAEDSGPTDTQLVVSFNDGPYKALSWDSVSWLVENMGTGQIVSIRKG